MTRKRSVLKKKAKHEDFVCSGVEGRWRRCREQKMPEEERHTHTEREEGERGSERRVRVTSPRKTRWKLFMN